MAVIQDCGNDYKDTIKSSRLLPLDGCSGVYVGNVGVFYRPLERTDALILLDPAGDSHINRVGTALSFPDILNIYPLLSEAGRAGVARSVHEAVKNARKVERQHPDDHGMRLIAEEHAGYLEKQFRMFYEVLTPTERAVVDEALKL